MVGNVVYLTSPGRIRVSCALDGTPDTLIQAVRAMGLEGIVAKDARSLYDRASAPAGGRSSSSTWRRSS